MKNWSFKKWNTLLGWGLFVVAFITYLSTIEPNFSFWDCGEYISSAVKLEVTHAPGAALFQIVGAVAAMLAFGNGQNYSIVINGISALFSALTILFLFWTITHLLRRLVKKAYDDMTPIQERSILFAGAIGALAFTFSDTFWFSAVEGEVYAMASLFIALLVWLITKWENEFHLPGNERWIIFIFFVVGLSVGVHMMCMLAIPCICLIYYAQKYEFSWKSFAIANGVTLLILAVVFKGIFPLIMTLFGKMEIFAVNGLGLPFHSGTIIAFVILVALFYFGISYARKSKSTLFQTIALSIVFMMIGFSCWLVIPIRANANPPMNLNNPDNAIGMLDYYNREQYGDWPTLYGQNYTAHLSYDGIEKNEDGSYKTVKTGDVYEKDEKTGTYRKVNDRFNYVYGKEHVSLFPRMFSEDRTVMQNYISMYGAPDFKFNYDNAEAADNPEAKRIFDELRAKYADKSIKVNDYLAVKNYEIINVQRPSLAQNLDYFFTFQNSYYFVRYLLWNFVGRQNDLEGHMENTNGNWISGISFIDDALYGNQEDMPAKFRNESTVAFYFLPFILGIIGFAFQSNRDFKRFYAVLSLFILTSVGIIFYTGVKPFEVRERDYAMVGSFYAFAIWIGLGAGAVLWYLQEKIKSSAANVVAGIVLLGIPFMMGFQNYQPHDRSDKYASYDYAYSFLNNIPKNGIAFVYGDNDTYPVWGIQETERFRDDVKVVNFTLLSTPWNIDQVKRRTYNAMPVPSVLTHEEYRDGANDQIYIMSKEDWQNLFYNLEQEGAPKEMLAGFRKYLTQDSMTVKEAISFIRTHSADKDYILKMLFGEEKYDRFNFLPTNKFVIPVNKENAVKAGIITAADLPKAEDRLVVTYEGNSMFKNNLILLDILANFDWKRSISFSSGGVYDNENLFYLQNYLQYDGFSYRLVPIKTEEELNGEKGRVNPLELYTTVKNFRWGNFKNLKNHYDETATSNIISYRSATGRAAAELALIGQKAKAIEILDLAAAEIPASKYNDAASLSSLVYGYMVAGQEGKALKMVDDLKKAIFAEYDYYAKLSPSEQRYLGSQMKNKPREYALVVSAVTDGYNKLGQKDKAYNYIVKSLEPVDKRFEEFVKYLQQIGKEKAYSQAEKVQKITPFFNFLFQIMEPYDSTYAKEKESQITNAIIQATK